MKPTPQPKPAPRAPKARVMYATPVIRNRLLVLNDKDIGCFPVAVIPCATSKQARALVKFANMTEDERVEAMVEIALHKQWNSYPQLARAIHDLIFKGGAK